MVAEVKAVDLIAGTQLLQRRWKILLAATVVAAMIAVGATAFVPPLYQSEVDIQLGIVDGDPVEDTQVLVKLLESDGVMRQWTGIGDGIRQPVQAMPVEAKPGGPVAYVRILARGRTADEARGLATQVFDFIRNRHAEIARTLQEDTSDYEQTLAKTVKQLGESVTRLEGILAQLRPGSSDSALVSVVLHEQLESKRGQYLELSKDLKEERMKRALSTKPTRQLAPPSMPSRPVWPSRLVFAVVGGGLGLAAAAIWILLLG